MFYIEKSLILFEYMSINKILKEVLEAEKKAEKDLEIAYQLSESILLKAKTRKEEKMKGIDDEFSIKLSREKEELTEKQQKRIQIATEKEKEKIRKSAEKNLKETTEYVIKRVALI